MAYPLQDRRALPAGLRFADAIGADGWRLRAFDWPLAGAGRRGSILFQSGRADFAEKYIESLAHWRDRGWGVSGFDWRGQGGSARSGTGAAWSLDAMIEDVAGFVARWITETPPPHVLIGHSMGGHLLLRLLAQRPPAVAGAVLVAPMLGLAHAPLSTAAARRIAGMACAIGLGNRPVWSPGAGAIGRQARLTGCADRYADEDWWRQANPALSVEPPNWHWLRGALGSIARLDAPGVLEQVAVPVLLIGTERDRLVSAAAIRRAAARLPRATLAMIDGAHELLREADIPRGEVFGAIDAFLDERARAA